MKCPQCEELGQTSRVAFGNKRVQKGLVVMFWDEEGREHNHNGTTVITPILCSKGHRWQHAGYNKCPTCGVQVIPTNEDAFGQAKS